MTSAEQSTDEPCERVPLASRPFRGFRVKWTTPTASGEATTIARTFSEAARNIGALVPAASVKARSI